MLVELAFSAVGFAITALICYFITPFIIKASLEAGMTTTDAHKVGRPIIGEPGGVAPLLAFIAGFASIVLLLVAYSTMGPPFAEVLISDEQLAFLLGALLAVVIAGLIGLLDDVFGLVIRHRQKILLGFLPAFPLMILRVGQPQVDIPLVGIVNFDVTIGSIVVPLFAFVVVPLATNFAFNSFNMLAGYNGLETGMGIIMNLSIFTVAWYVGDTSIMLFTASMTGALVAFFFFNKHPAKVLVGDAGTLMMGTALIVALILGNMEKLALGLFFLHFINFVLFFVYIYTKQTDKLADIEVDEGSGKVYLRPPCPYTIYWVLPYYFNLTERQNVYALLGIQTVICAATVAWFILLG